MSTNRHIIVLEKGSEKYIVVYDDGREQLAVQQVLTWATCDDLSFSMRDAEGLAMHIKAGRAAA